MMTSTSNQGYPALIGCKENSFASWPDDTRVSAQCLWGAGVHVEYVSRELAKSIDVEVHCWGDQFLDEGNLHVRGAQPWSQITQGTQEKYKTALETLSLNLAQMKPLATIDIVHTHTWYVSMAGFLAKKLFDIPFVLTTHIRTTRNSSYTKSIWRAYWIPRQSQPGDGTSSLPSGIRIPTENSNKLGAKDGGIPFLLSPRQLPGDQDKNENENRFCA
jgi:hypothetical protein